MQSYNDVVLETIEEVILNVFEEDTKEILFQFLDGSNPKNIYEKIHFFSRSLPKILSESHVIIEDMILETLYSKYRIEFTLKKDFQFLDYIIDLGRQVRDRDEA
jgi:hypothetical protein